MSVWIIFRHYQGHAKQFWKYCDSKEAAQKDFEILNNFNPEIAYFTMEEFTPVKK